MGVTYLTFTISSDAGYADLPRGSEITSRIQVRDFTFASAHAFRDLALVKCFGVLSATFATAISTHL